MKKLLKSLSLCLVLLCLVFSFTACNFIRLVVKDPTGGVGANPQDTPIKGEVDGDTYQKTYDVKGVDLKLQTTNGKQKLTTEQVVENVYNSVVSVRVSDGKNTSSGSGTIIDIDVEYEDENLDTDNFYYVLTCHHVIEDATTFVVYLPKLVDSESGEYSFMDYAFGATLIGGHKQSDVAILRIEVNEDSYEDFSPSEIVKAPICKDYLVRGESVIAIGNPGGDLPGTVTKGITSNVCVDVNVENIGSMKLIQMDAALNPGNSGGALFNMYGQLVGVTNAGDTDSDGIAFAVPMTGDMGAISKATALISTSTDELPGYVEGEWKLGVTFSNATDRMGNVIGVRIEAIETWSPLYGFNIKKDSYIESIAYIYGEKSYSLTVKNLTEFNTFYNTMQEHLKIGDKVTVTISGYGFAETDYEITLNQYIYRVPTVA